MTEEEKAAAAKAKEDADAEFEATLGDDLTDEEKETKRQEHAAQHSDNNDQELDSELAAEQERTRLANEAFQKREEARKKREADAGGNEDDDRPLTRADLARISADATAAAMKVANAAQVLAIAKTLATSDKEATLIAAKWGNRTFPEGMTLQDQVEEMYAVTNRKKLIGERNEALRAARNKGNANTNSAATHVDGPSSGEPKLSAADKTALQQSGFVWDTNKRLYKKPLSKGRFLYRDAKGTRTFQGS